MVKNDMAVHMGDVYIDQRQQQAVFDQPQQQAAFIDKVQIGGNDPSAKASLEANGPLKGQTTQRPLPLLSPQHRPRHSTRS